MDFDPRSIDDSRDRDVDGRELNQGSRGGLSNPRERERLAPRDAFTRDLELPRGRERKRVWAGDSDVTLRGSEVRTMLPSVLSAWSLPAISAMATTVRSTRTGAICGTSRTRGWSTRFRPAVMTRRWWC